MRLYCVLVAVQTSVCACAYPSVKDEQNISYICKFTLLTQSCVGKKRPRSDPRVGLRAAEIKASVMEPAAALKLALAQSSTHIFA